MTAGHSASLSFPLQASLSRESPMPLILASASPRRVDLLHQIGYPPDRVVPAIIDETPRARELPRDVALRLARAKAEAVRQSCPGAYVIAADTVVARGRRVLPKPIDAEQARRCLMLLSGARHRVYGGLAVAAPDGRLTGRVIVTQVAFKQLTDDEVRRYLATGEWQDKAGGYAIQGRAAAFVRQLIGSYSNVVGLPLFETVQLLNGLGYRPVDGEGDADGN